MTRRRDFALNDVRRDCTRVSVMSVSYGRAVKPGALTFRSQGVECSALLFRPDSSGDVPCVILAHGFDGVREQRLTAYAERFADAGLAALVFDYRGFGASDGHPRQHFSNGAQLQDYRAAIDCALGLEGIGKVALWGTSTSGGHVIRVAADDPRVAAVVAQMPFTSGFEQFLSLPITRSLQLLWAGLRDQVRGWLRLEPLYIPAGGQSYAFAVNNSPDSLSGFYAITPPETTWENRVLARFALTTTFYRPGAAAKRLRCPLLVCVADGDRIIPARGALKAARHGALRRYASSHFGMYVGVGFEAAVADQVAFLRRELVP
jgi:dienelactone hydrolase